MHHCVPNVIFRTLCEAVYSLLKPPRFIFVLIIFLIAFSISLFLRHMLQFDGQLIQYQRNLHLECSNSLRHIQSLFLRARYEVSRLSKTVDKTVVLCIVIYSL